MDSVIQLRFQKLIMLSHQIFWKKTYVLTESDILILSDADRKIEVLEGRGIDEA